MASISVPCPKSSATRRAAAAFYRPISSPLVGFLQISLSNGAKQRNFPVLKAQVTTENSSVSSLTSSTTSKAELSNGKVGETVEESTGPAEIPGSVLTAFMAEVSDIVNGRGNNERGKEVFRSSTVIATGVMIIGRVVPPAARLMG